MAKEIAAIEAQARFHDFLSNKIAAEPEILQHIKEANAAPVGSILKKIGAFLMKIIVKLWLCRHQSSDIKLPDVISEEWLLEEFQRFLDKLYPVG